MGIWRCELSPSLGVLVRTCGSWLSLQDLMVVIILVASLVLQGVVRLRDPRWNGEEVVVIVLR